METILDSRPSQRVLAAEPIGDEFASGYLPTLDGWRAVAITLVLVCHALPFDLAKKGAVGVDLFFGLSGFLIGSRLLAERRRTGRICLPSFYVRRSFRIVPPYLAYLGVVAILGAVGVIMVGRGELTSCLLFYRNYLPPEGRGGWYTGHFWSLAVEEHFYLIWPALLIAMGTRGAHGKVAALALLIAAWRVAEHRLGLIQRHLPGINLYARTDVCLDSLLWGGWMALVLERRTWRERLELWLDTKLLALLIAAALGCIFLRPPLWKAGLAMLVPWLLAATVLRPGDRLGAWLEAPMLRWMGRRSYSLYLWQQLFLPESAFVARDMAWLQVWPLNLLAVFACAMISYRLIERPMIRMGHTLSTKVTTTPTSPRTGWHRLVCGAVSPNRGRIDVGDNTDR
jgi:peptidoglycan/LPS O-acetylase OafA/YrhL